MRRHTPADRSAAEPAPLAQCADHLRLLRTAATYQQMIQHTHAGNITSALPVVPNRTDTRRQQAAQVAAVSAASPSSAVEATPTRGRLRTRSRPPPCEVRSSPSIRRRLPYPVVAPQAPLMRYLGRFGVHLIRALAAVENSRAPRTTYPSQPG